MKTFRDANGCEWRIDINCDSVARIKDLLGVNVLDVCDPDSDLMQQLVAFPPLCGRILFACATNREGKAAEDEKLFARALNGDAISDGMEALLAEIVNFSPRNRRPLLEAVVSKNREVQETAVRLGLERLNDPGLMALAEQRLREEIQAEIDRRLGSRPQLGLASPSETESSMPAGPPPESWESTPDVIRGGSSA